MQSEESPLNWIIELQGDPDGAQDSLYLLATIDPEAHVTLDAKINFLAAFTLLNLGATEILCILGLL